MGGLLINANTFPESPVERMILDRIKNGERRAEWMDLMAKFNPTTDETLHHIVDQIPTFVDSAEMVSSIDILTRANMMRLSPMEPELRQTITDYIGTHMYSADPAIRAAAIGSLSSFSHPEAESLVLGALRDTDGIVSQRAMDVLFTAGMKSPEIKDVLLSTLRDDTAEFGLRWKAKHALEKYPLEGQDYEDVSKFSPPDDEYQSESAY